MKRPTVGVAVGGIPISVTSRGPNCFVHILTMGRMKETQTGIGT